MGTIEHFDETERAVGEIARVLRPGGIAIVGVPNRHDPFLRPLLVTVLQAAGLYAYGYEKSYSRRALRPRPPVREFERAPTSCRSAGKSRASSPSLSRSRQLLTSCGHFRGAPPLVVVMR